MAKATPTKTDLSNIVKPTMEFEGAKEHALRVLFTGDAQALPEVRSVGYMRLPGGNTYVSYSMTTKGNEVLKIEVDEPNLRAIAEDSAKVLFVSAFSYDE